jgi:hypothetical protein
LLLRYTSDSYSSGFITTIGVDYRVKNVSVDGHVVRLQVRWIARPLDCLLTFFCLQILYLSRPVSQLFL